MKIDCIHINFYGLDWLLKNAGCNKMCHYFHSRLLEQCKEFGIFFVRKTKYITVDAWVCFRLAPTFVLFLFLFSIHYKIHFNIQQNPDFGGCFKSSPPVGGASGFEARNGFRVPQNITCSVRVNRKSALRDGLGKAEKNGFSPFRPQLRYSNDFSIYPLHLNPYKVRVAFPNDCPVAHNQTLPTNAPNYLIKRVHRNNLLLCAISHASLFAGIRSRWQL